MCEDHRTCNELVKQRGAHDGVESIVCVVKNLANGAAVALQHGRCSKHLHCLADHVWNRENQLLIVDKCARRGMRLTTYRVARDELLHFHVEQVAQVDRGRLSYPAAHQ